MSILTHSPAIVRDGLILCLDAGAVRSYPGAGPQLVVNGDFASDITTGWEAGDSTTGQSHDTHSDGDGGRLKLVDGGSLSRLYSSAAITLVIGQKYRFSVTVSGTSTNHFVHTGTAKGGPGAPLTNFTLGSPDGTYVHDFVATATTFYIHLGATGGSTQYFDQVSLVAIASNLPLPGGSGFSSGVSYGVPGANQWSDLSGNNNNGTLNNMQYDLDAESGAGGTRSFDFDGSSDYMQLDKSGTGDYTGALTVSAWFKADSSATGRLVAKDQASGANPRWLFYKSGATLHFYFNDNANTEPYLTTTLTYGDWYHVAVTITSGSQKLYLNGAEVGSDTETTSNFTTDTNLWIGRYASASYWDGKIAIVHLYSRALTAAEIQQNYRTHKGRFGK